MITIPGDKIVYSDADDTLVFWNATKEQRDKHGVVTFTHPGSMVFDTDGEEIGYAGEWTQELVPNWPQIEELKRFKIRGYKIVLWTQSGSMWGEVIAKTLKIENLIDVCITKPNYIFDDLPASEFMPKSRLITKDQNENP